jgi:hypothetical protein
MNTRALEHEGAMAEVYSKMKPDAFPSQLQTVLTAHYEDIKGVMSASGCTKSKVVKRKFKDQDDTGLAPDADAAYASTAAGAGAADAATSVIPPDGGAEPHPAGKSLLLPPSLLPRAGAARGRREGVLKRVLARPQADAD